MSLEGNLSTPTHHSTYVPDIACAPRMQAEKLDNRLFTTRTMVSKVITITPELAQQFLDERVKIVHNKSHARIEQYAAVMNNDGWLTTHQGIAFNWDGKLVDGYLRLQAVARSGKAITTPVTFGLDPDVFRAIDTGFSRKSVHLLKLAGVSNTVAQKAAAGITLYMRYQCVLEEGKLPKASRFTPQKALSFYEKHPDFIYFAEETLGPKQTWKEVISPAVAISLVYMAQEKRHPLELTLSFLKGLGNFAGQGEYSPILVLYKHLAKQKMDGVRLRPEVALAKTIYAYNKWVRKDKLQTIQGVGSFSKTDITIEDEPLSSERFPSVLQYSKPHHRDVHETEYT